MEPHVTAAQIVRAHTILKALKMSEDDRSSTIYRAMKAISDAADEGKFEAKIDCGIDNANLHHFLTASGYSFKEYKNESYTSRNYPYTIAISWYQDLEAQPLKSARDTRTKPPQGQP